MHFSFKNNVKEEVYKTLKNKHCFNLKEFKEEEIRMTFFG